MFPTDAVISLLVPVKQTTRSAPFPAFCGMTYLYPTSSMTLNLDGVVRVHWGVQRSSDPCRPSQLPTRSPSPSNGNTTHGSRSGSHVLKLELSQQQYTVLRFELILLCTKVWVQSNEILKIFFLFKCSIKVKEVKMEQQIRLMKQQWQLQIILTGVSHTGKRYRHGSMRAFAADNDRQDKD